MTNTFVLGTRCYWSTSRSTGMILSCEQPAMFAHTHTQNVWELTNGHGETKVRTVLINGFKMILHTSVIHKWLDVNHQLHAKHLQRYSNPQTTSHVLAKDQN